MFKTILSNLKEKSPLIHCITNYVTVNDCANILLACGASPIMADDSKEVEDITSICNGLTINIGTINNNLILSMILAGKKANQLNHPVVFDPVGAGASNFRNQASDKLLKEINFKVIRGNISEIKSLALGDFATKGVDANILDKVSEKNLDKVIDFAKEFSKKTNAIIAITGEIDLIVDSKRVCIVKNGHKMMSEITGSGCMLSVLISAMVSANLDKAFEATVGAVCSIGLAGEMAYKRLKEKEGNLSYRNYLIDQIYNLTDDILMNGAKYELR